MLMELSINTWLFSLVWSLTHRYLYFSYIWKTLQDDSLFLPIAVVHDFEKVISNVFRVLKYFLKMYGILLCVALKIRPKNTPPTNSTFEMISSRVPINAKKEIFSESGYQFSPIAGSQDKENTDYNHSSAICDLRPHHVCTQCAFALRHLEEVVYSRSLVCRNALWVLHTLYTIIII